MKRIVFILLGLAMVCAHAQAAVNARLDQTAILLDEGGKVLTPVGMYSDIVSLGNGLYAACQDEYYALMDSRGALLTQPVYRQLRLEGGLLMAQRGTAWGLLRTDGSICSAFEYSVIVPTGYGGAWALRGDPDDTRSDRLFLLNLQGRETETGLFVRGLGTPGDSGLLPVLLSASGWWGYCDMQGSVVISGEYSYAGPFISGRAVVVEDGHYGVVDTQGMQIVPSRYDFLQISAAGFILALGDESGAEIMDLNGAILATYPDSAVSAALVGDGYAIWKDSALYLFDKQAQLLAELPADASVMEGLDGAYIVSTGMWGEICVRLLGSESLYQNLYPLGWVEGEAVYACMEANTARYINDMLGEIQLSTDMESARYGIVDQSGALRVPCAYESIAFLDNGRFLTRNGDLWQMIDINGQVYWEFTQTEAPSS